MALIKFWVLAAIAIENLRSCLTCRDCKPARIHSSTREEAGEAELPEGIQSLLKTTMKAKKLRRLGMRYWKKRMRYSLARGKADTLPGPEQG